MILDTLLIPLGLIGLGVIVIVHELGHLAAARALGVEVEAFSIGWGPKIAGFKRGGIEWRLSAFPIGGYCKMKGEDGFRKALEEKSAEIPRESGSFYGASPWRRILISLAGPFANVVFAAIVYVLVAAVGYKEPVQPNRIILASEYNLDGSAAKRSFPADAAGLKTGDRIVSANGQAIDDYAGIQEIVALSADRVLRLGVERDGVLLELEARPAMDRETGAGRIGVYSWIEPLVERVESGGAAAIAGLRAGDRITAINGAGVRNSIEASAILLGKPERVTIEVDRDGARAEFHAVLSWTDKGANNLGIVFATRVRAVKALSPIAAFAAGGAETWKTFSVTVRGLGTLFRGVNLSKAVSGPARITYLVGRSATEGIRQDGLSQTLRVLAFLSIALFIMNLLPIPALDGGLILMFLLEILRRRPMRPINVYRYQFAGVALILAIFLFASYGDVLFFVGK